MPMPDADDGRVAMKDSSLCELWHGVKRWMWDVDAKNVAMIMWSC